MPFFQPHFDLFCSPPHPSLIDPSPICEFRIPTFSMKRSPRPSQPDTPDPSPESSPPAPDSPAERTDALADGLRKSVREGDIRDREYARQMQELAREERAEE